MNDTQIIATLSGLMALAILIRGLMRRRLARQIAEERNMLVLSPSQRVGGSTGRDERKWRRAYSTA